MILRNKVILARTIYTLSGISVRRDGRGNEPAQVGLRFLQIGQIQIHHVPGGIGVEREVFQEGGVNIKVIEGVARGKQGRGQVVVAARHVDPEERIAGDGSGLPDAPSENRSAAAWLLSNRRF
jgi:hypothetical protein